MKKQKYGIYEIPSDLNPISQEEKKHMLNHILGLSMYEVDFEAANRLCELYIESKIPDIRCISLTCSSHIARVYEQSVSETMLEKMRKIANDPSDELCGYAKYILEEINWFLSREERERIAATMEKKIVPVRREDLCCGDMYEAITNKVVDYYPLCRTYDSLISENRVSQFNFCPWCGKKLPSDLTKEFYSILEKQYGVPYPDTDYHTNLPEEFKTDEWWKKRGL
jgi:hypothetical protein